MLNTHTYFRRNNNFMQRRRLYPRVRRLGGLYFAPEQPVDDPLLDEIKEMMKKMPLTRGPTDGEVALVGSMSNELEDEQTDNMNAENAESPRDQQPHVFGEGH